MTSNPTIGLGKKSRTICFLFYLIGIGGFFLYVERNNSSPWGMSSENYVSENALNPGQAAPRFDDLSIAREFTRKTSNLTVNAVNEIVSTINSIFLETTLHKYTTKNGEEDTNIIISVPSRSSNSQECIVITAPYYKTPRKIRKNEVDGGGMAVALAYYLKTVPWLSKDVLVILTNSEYQDEGIENWLKDYHFPRADEPFDFVRRGGIAVALALDFSITSVEFIIMVPEGIDGRMPNLDLMNTVYRVSVITERQSVIMYDPSNLISRFFYSDMQRFFGFSFNKIEGQASLTLTTLFSQVFTMAIGLPTGSHSHFLNYNIDAITLKIYEKQSFEEADRSVRAFGRVLEGTVRSFSNLIEHLHQSFYFYLSPNPYSYVSIGQYMINHGLVLSSALIVGISIVFSGDFEQLKWAITRVIIFSFYGLFLYGAACVVDSDDAREMAILAGIASVVTLFIIKRLSPKSPSYDDKLISLWTSYFPLLLFLSVYSMKNFCFCFLMAVIISPFLFIINPSRTFLGKIFYTILLYCTSPYNILLLISLSLRSSVSEIFSILMEHHLRYGTVTAAFFFAVYVPLHLSQVALVLLEC